MIKRLFAGSPQRIAVGIGMTKIVRAILTVVSVMVSARYFGATLERDVYVLSVSAVALLTQVIYGPLNETFRIKFLHVLAEEGEDRARQSVATLLQWVALFSLGLVLVVIIWPGCMLHLLAPGFSGAQYAPIARMLAVYIPMLILTELSVLFASVLNAYHSYYLPEFFALGSVLLSIVCTVLAAPFIGIYSLVIASYLTQGIQLGLYARALRRTGLFLWLPRLVSWRTVGPYFFFGLPLYIAYLTGQFHAVIERRVCTYLGEGNLSMLDYARKFMDLPLTTMVGVAGSVVAPILTRQVADLNGFSASVVKFIKLFTLGAAPFCALLIVFPEELVRLLLLRGAFKPEHIAGTAETIRWFGIGVLGLPFYTVCGQALLARNQRFAYIASSTAVLLLSAALNLLIYRWLGVATMAMTWAMVSMGGGLLMFACLPVSRRLTYIGQLLPPLLVAVALVGVYGMIHACRESLAGMVRWPVPTALMELLLSGVVAAISLALFLPYYRRQNRLL
ncbi:MAG: hypothetical protein EPN23_08340 [Verrucomicrobia bacterium]|nr:MAG: hypothetical protein EPN23_08340 [Verrucomicrobiota bacterium]